MAEFRQVQLALELYKSQRDDKTYPLPSAESHSCGNPFPTPERRSFDDGPCAGAYIQSLVDQNFIAALPSEIRSANPNCEIEYRTDSAGTWYKLTAENCIAGGQEMTANDELARCSSTCTAAPGTCADGNMSTMQITTDFTKSFAVYSNNGQCK
jgi:hypothetical protein